MPAKKIPLEPGKKEVKPVKRKDIPRLPKEEKEYLVKFYFRYDELQKKQFYVISLETLKIFRTLSYGISVDVTKSKDTIDIKILGLNTKSSYIVQPKQAATELFFEDLYGNFKVLVHKHDKLFNSINASFNIFTKSISLKKDLSKAAKTAKKQFCVFEVDENKFSFKENN
ncbi:MAG: hypothetical protein HUU54_03370 [Ignavibacteriaceae bacterium]|nr:hypothetical protein [Ignavibacteriaceae bacterium]